MIAYCKQNLLELKHLLNTIDSDQFTQKSKLLSGASISQHIRHILEFYLCLINGTKNGVVNYDNRKRNTQIENDIDFANESINEIYNNLDLLKNDVNITLEGNFSLNDSSKISIESSLNRELSYCLEHSIHHQALIKIGLIEQNLQYLINEEFGIAPSTIRATSNCK